jgi:hypothetical protein
MPIIPADQSPYKWTNEHRTVGTTLDKYFTAYNPTSPLNRGLSAMEILRTAARELEQLLRDARARLRSTLERKGRAGRSMILP